MSEILATIVMSVLVFGGPIGCIVKAALGMEQRNHLPQKLVDELYK